MTETTKTTQTTEAAVIIETLTIEEKKVLVNAESRIRNGLKSFVAVGQSLLVIRDGRLYRSQFATFDKYCAEKFDMTRARACQLISAAILHDSLKSLDVKSSMLPKTESQCRPFGRLADSVTMDEKAGIWLTIAEPITALKVNKAVSDFLGAVDPVVTPVVEVAPAADGDTISSIDDESEVDTKAVLLERLRTANEKIAFLETALEAEKAAHRMTIDAKGLALTQTIKAVLKKGIAAYTKGKTIGEVNGLSTELQELIDIVRK